MNEKAPPPAPTLSSLPGPLRVKQIAEQLRSKQQVPPTTVRQLLSWFNSERRGSIIVWWIQDSLSKAGLTTKPDFVGEYIDGLVEFALVEAHDQQPSDKDRDTVTTPTNLEPEIDPTYRIGRLRSANTIPLSVKPNQTVQEAITLMLLHNFSQLPVMTNEREVKGIVSWLSIGSRLQFGKKFNEVRECMGNAHIVSAETSLFDAIGDIVKHQCVLIRDAANKIIGIVTTSDLSEQFQQLAEPFLLLGEIENHIRRIIDRGKFSSPELKDCCDPGDTQRKIEGIHHLTFGEYIRLLEKPTSWEKLKLPIDRATLVSKLDKVREIRNNVMHFDPDGVSDDDLRTLRNVSRFFQNVGSVLSSK